MEEEKDFWKMALQFFEQNMPKDFESKINDFVSEKHLKGNELILFKHMLKEAFAFHLTLASMKSDIQKNNQ